MKLREFYSSFQLKKWQRRQRVETPELNRDKVMRDEFLFHSYQTTTKTLLMNVGYSCNEGVWLELGSAGGITKEIYPTVITSDIRTSKSIDLKIAADELIPFEDSSIDGIIVKDTLHHLANLDRHFSEIFRCLKPGGSVAYAEPNWNAFSQFIFSFLHPEPYVKDTKFASETEADPMFSNQAIPYLLFQSKSIPISQLGHSLSVKVLETPRLGISYLLAGGVFNRNRLPSRLLMALDRVENRCTVWMKTFGIQRIIVVTKT